MDPKPKKSIWPTILCITLLLLILTFFFFSFFMRSVKASDRTAALNKGKNLYTALFSFAKENEGIYPSEVTALEGESADTVEACFTQLLNRGEIQDEEIFYIPRNKIIGNLNKQKPNNNGTVDPGENAWGYLRGLTTESQPNTPLIFESVVGPGLFTTATWEGRALVVKLNGSAQAMDINVKGKPLNEDGSPKHGPILEKRGDKTVNIFTKQNLPPNTKILIPTKP